MDSLADEGLPRPNIISLRCDSLRDADNLFVQEPCNFLQVVILILAWRALAGGELGPCPLDRIARSQPDLVDSYAILDDRERSYYEHRFVPRLNQQVY